MMKKREKLGIALGGGTMRGMAHIGVLKILEENGIIPDVLVGCSSGAVVAAAYACGRLDGLSQTALSLGKKSRRALLDFCFTGEGLIRGKKLTSLFDFLTAQKKFEDLRGVKLAFVGTDALSGEEVVIDTGSITKALEITTALPGLAPLKRFNGRLVFDGGTAMLVPTKVAYALGADKVIGVDVSANRGVVTRAVGDFRKMMQGSTIRKIAEPVFKIRDKVQEANERRFFGRIRDLMKKIRLLDDYEKHSFNFIESYLIGLRAISADYKRGLFHENDCDMAIYPDVMGFKRTGVTEAAGMIAKGREAALSALEDIKKLLG